MTNRFKGWKTQEDTVPIYRSTWAKGQPVYPPTWPAGFATCATLGTKKDHFNAYNFDCDSEQKFICVGKRTFNAISTQSISAEGNLLLFTVL